jgi:hypothetical protein
MLVNHAHSPFEHLSLAAYLFLSRRVQFLFHLNVGNAERLGRPVPAAWPWPLHLGAPGVTPVRQLILLFAQLLCAILRRAVQLAHGACDADSTQSI